MAKRQAVDTGLKQSYTYFQHTDKEAIDKLHTGKTSAYDMIYLLTAIGLSPCGSSTVHIYTQTIHRTIQNKQYVEQHNNFGRVRAVPRLG